MTKFGIKRIFGVRNIYNYNENPQTNSTRTQGDQAERGGEEQTTGQSEHYAIL